MTTTVLPVDANAPAAEAIARAAAVLRGGGVVAFPTETVYGLGANALEATAVARIFLAKGRPANNPIIVHVADLEGVRSVVADWPATAERLARRYWPGPLSLVLPKRSEVPDLVTAGGPTVAVRVPAHPVALALIRATGVPIAAPSANRSSELSPTRAEHVLRGLDGRIDLVLDAGLTPGGIESTVVDLTSAPPRLLRPGLVTLAELEAELGTLVRKPIPDDTTGALPSPGLLPRHYAPRTPTECVDNGSERVRELTAAGVRVGWLALTVGEPPSLPNVAALSLPPDPVAYASGLYAALHTLDVAGLDRIVIDRPPDVEEWLAVRDRLRRAAG